MTRHTRALPLVLLLLGAAACAPALHEGPPRHASLLTARPPPPGRACRLASAPRVLPGGDQVVDIAALDRAVRTLWTERGMETGYAIVSLAFDENGWNMRREVIEHDLPPAAADSLQKLVFAHGRAVAPGEPWGVRLRIDVAGSPRFQVGRQEHCAPKPLEPTELVEGVGTWGRADPFAASPGAGRNRAWVRVLVDESGIVSDAQVERSAVGLRWEGPLLNYVRALAFRPALVDGIPVAGWVRVPVTLPGW